VLLSLQVGGQPLVRVWEACMAPQTSHTCILFSFSRTDEAMNSGTTARTQPVLLPVSAHRPV